MILTKLTLHNFGIYAGRHTVNLKPKNNKPIILIGALNGSGKTTLLEGIQFSIFGKMARFLGKNKTAYLEFLMNSINRRNLQNSASVGVEFISNRNGEIQKYEVVRTWSLKGNGTPIDTVQVLKNGQLDTELSERWSEISETFFPSQLSDLFFFDGERIESLAQPERCSELIRTGLNSLLGLDLVTDLNKTLTTLDRKIKIDGVSQASKKKLEHLNEKISSLNNDFIGVETDLLQSKNTIKDLLIKLEDLRSKLKQQGGDLYLKRDELVQRQNDLIKLIDEKRQELVQISSTVLPLSLLTESIKELETLSLRGLTASQKEVVKESLEAFSSDILKELSLKKFLNEENLKLIKSVHTAFLKIDSITINRPDIELSREAIFRCRTECAIQNANGLKLVIELSKLQNELSQTERMLIAAPDEDKLKSLFSEISETEEEIRKKEFNQKFLIDEKLKIERELDIANKLFNSGSIELNKQKSSEIIFTLIKERINSGQQVLKLFEEKIRNKHIQTLEVLIKDGFSTLLRKKIFVESISICKNTFELTINIRGEGLVLASKLSAGERQLLAVAVLWALAKASGIKLPTVIDTPLGRLDSKHRSSFVKNYFPNAGEQVILLSTDEEIVGTYYDSLKKNISHTYIINYNEEEQSSTISEGYFDSLREEA